MQVLENFRFEKKNHYLELYKESGNREMPDNVRLYTFTELGVNLDEENLISNKDNTRAITNKRRIKPTKRAEVRIEENINSSKPEKSFSKEFQSFLSHKEPSIILDNELKEYKKEETKNILTIDDDDTNDSD